MDRLEIISQHVDPLILTECSQYAISIKLNRPRSLNAFSSGLINSLSDTLSNLQANLLVLSSTSSSHFCVGGDIKESTEGGLHSIRNYAFMVSNFYEISLFPSSVSLMQGLAIGAGCGLAMACRYRVSTHSTRFMMPESAIGLAPDCGASYFFTRLPNKALGLYLMITGKKITGNDCYWAQIATHYVTDDKIQGLQQEILRTGDVEGALEQYATQPNYEESEIVRNISEIEEIFTGVHSIETIIERLYAKKSKFAQETLKQISALCPLSLKVSFKRFFNAADKTYKECLEKDIAVTVQLGFRRCNNYKSAREKFMKKSSEPIAWDPATLAEVTDSLVDSILSNSEGPNPLLPLIPHISIF